jgi:hypothetical protein
MGVQYFLSPGLKSDILSGKTGCFQPQPPASSHIVQSADRGKRAQNAPLSIIVPYYSTTNILKKQVFF